ncbi:MAG: DUF58 domain-containing protein [Chloroflexi bacterium]|nr:DUF58 domain-containing protein [Chloroflexota bacterium]
MRTRRFFFLVLIIISLTLTLASGFYAMSRLFTVLMTAGVLSWLWSRFSLRGIEAGADGRTTLAQVGDTVEERVWIRNHSNFPRAWVHVEDLGDVPSIPSHVAGLAPRGYRSWPLRTRGSRRGRFRWGPLRLTSGDPLGLFRSERVIPGTQMITIYPAPVPLHDFVLSTSDQSGDAPDYRATSQITPNVVSVRRYETGDSLNRIHWKSSAKRGLLMVKEFETEVHGDLWIALDLNGAAQVGADADDTEETAVTIAASLAGFLLGYDNGVGFLASGDREYVATPATGDKQLWQILEMLALCRATGSRPLSVFLGAQAPRFGTQTGLIVITPSITEAVAAGAYMLERNSPGAVVLLEPASFGGSSSELPLLGRLLSTGVAVYIVRKGDDIAKALSVSALGAAAMQPGTRRGFATPGRSGS